MEREPVFNAFVMNAPTHNAHGLWRAPHARNIGFSQPDMWVDLARRLEDAHFDAMFFADVVGTWDGYRGGWQESVARAVQFPVHDPSVLIPILAYVTRNLGFAFTSSIIQEPPFNFARRVSTLDHLSQGRIGWNIVTNALGNAARNFGLPDVPPHTERYRWAAEYAEVVYKLWEHSWDDGALVRDREAGIFADPAKVHAINHSGSRYKVEGPHLTEPSPQGTPLLMQAGSSENGRQFAARHAEGVFIHTPTPDAAAVVVSDIRARAVAAGRNADDLIFLQDLSFVVAPNDAEAEEKDRQLTAWFDPEGSLAQMSAAYGIDFSTIDLDRPIGDFQSTRHQGIIRSLIEAQSDKSRTFRDILGVQPTAGRLVGSPDRIVAAIEDWVKAGVDGFNVGFLTLPGSYVDFIELVAPRLKKKGLMQSTYREGTLREKIFPGRGPRISSAHPARRGDWTDFSKIG